MPHSIGWTDECNAERDEARNVERIARIKATRRLAQTWNWAVRVDPPEEEAEEEDR